MSRRPPLYRPLDWLMVRAPLQPIEAYLALADAPHDELPHDDPWVRRALEVGGGDLARALAHPPTGEAARARLARKLLRYLIRMSTRPTPYGLFAGVALASWGDTTDLALAPGPPRPRTRPDMGWLMSVVAAAEQRPEVRAELRWYANPAAHVQDGRVVLDEAASLDGAEGRPVSLRATAPVLRLLELARTPTPHRELVDALVAAGAPEAKAVRLMDQLWEHTVLLTDLRPPLTVASPAAHVAERLRRIPAAQADADTLSALLSTMAHWDRQVAASAIGAQGEQDAARPDASGSACGYAELAAAAHALHPVDGAQVPLQTDMTLPLAGSRVNRTVALEAARAAELLMRLSPAPDGPSAIEGYRRAFEAKYGDEQEVPILALLDPVTGLGPPNHGQGGSNVQNEERHHFLRSLALDAIRDGRTVVDLDEAALRKLETWPVSGATAPASLDVAVFVVARSAQALDAGDFQVVVGPNLGGQSAGRNLGRFADLLGPPAEAALRAVADGEAAVRPGRLTAEIVYLPRRTRSANVVIRPMVRDGEIVLGTMPEGTRTIPLDELVVGLDDDGRFRVRWPARDIEVVPCTGHMLTTTQAPPAIRLLDDISRDGQPQLGSAPWASVADLPFLPRVRSGRVVLFPAMWTVGADVRPDTLAAWRKRWMVPRHVYLASGDNRLLLDLADPRQAGQLHAEIDKRPAGGRVFLQEALPGPEHAWLPGPQGGYISEFVVPVVLDAAHAVPARPQKSRSRVVRTSSPLPEEVLRPPGSDWLYAKLYHPPHLDEHLAAGPVRDFCRDMTERGWAESWFFLRYHDSAPHLRLRLHGDPRTLSTKVLPELLAWANSLTAEALCERFAIDTYEREIERYGGPLAMPWAESLFAADSHAVTELLALLSDMDTEPEADTPPRTEADGKKAKSGRLDRTLLAVRSVDELLAGLGFDAPARARWCRDRMDRAGRSQQRAVGVRYRAHAADLRTLLADDDWLAERRGGAQALAVLGTLRQEAAAAAAAFDELRGRGELWQPMDRLAGSFVHMHCNRFLVSGRDEETQVIGLLQRARAGLLHAPRPAAIPRAGGADDPRRAGANCVDAGARPL